MLQITKYHPMCEVLRNVTAYTAFNQTIKFKAKVVVFLNVMLKIVDPKHLF